MGFISDRLGFGKKKQVQDTRTALEQARDPKSRQGLSGSSLKLVENLLNTGIDGRGPFDSAAQVADKALAKHGAEARCGLLVVDIRNGDTVGWVRLEGIVRELFDVAVFPGVQNPAAIGFVSDEIKRIISIDEG